MRLDQRRQKIRRLKSRAEKILDEAEDEDRPLSDAEARIVDGLTREARELYLSVATPSERREHKRQWNAIENE